jgi:hypothetical protein
MIYRVPTKGILTGRIDEYPRISEAEPNALSCACRAETALPAAEIMESLPLE